MTLLAAFQHEGVPILLGDFLVTAQDQCGTRKKIHLISPNFVIGWTDHRFAAQIVLRELDERFHGQHVSQTHVEDFLTHYPPSDLGSLGFLLVGWIVDGGPHCFLWNSLYPHEMFYSSDHLVGIGAPVFQGFLDNPGYLAASAGLPKVERAVLFSLTQCCRLISDEVLAGANQETGFGFAFEILYFDGQQFRFVDDISYSFFDILYDVRQSLIFPHFHGAIVKYRSFESYSVVQINLPNENRMRFFVMTPVFDDMPDLLTRIPGIDVSRNQSFSAKSDYYCVYYRVHTSDGILRHGAIVHRSSDPGNLVTVTRDSEGGEHFEVDFGFIRQLYPVMLNEGWVRKISGKQRIVSPGGTVQFTIAQSDRNLALGLANQALALLFTDLAHALWCRSDGLVQAYESGIAVGKPQRYVEGDILEIGLSYANDRPTIAYKHNGNAFHSSQTRPNFPFLIQVFAKKEGGKIRQTIVRSLRAELT
jgi:hypothetical protein